MAAKQHNPYTSTRDRANAFNISTRGEQLGFLVMKSSTTGGKDLMICWNMVINGYEDRKYCYNLSFAYIKFTKSNTWNNDLTQNQGLGCCH